MAGKGLGDGPIFDFNDFNVPRKIDEHFILQKNHNGDWSMVMKEGNMKVNVGADPYHVALWISREGFYSLIKKIYAATTIEEVKSILSKTKLNWSKIQGAPDVQP